MSDNDRTLQIIEWSDVGTEDVIRASQSVRDSVIDATEAINDANAAAENFRDGVSDIPSIPMPTPMPIPFDTEEVKEATRQIEKVSESAIDAGNASEMLYSALDSVIPGLGGIAESLFSLNPLAIAGTAALTGVALVMGELQRQSEEAAKAIALQIEIENKRIGLEAELAQRANFANSGEEGSVAARQSIIADYAEAIANAAVLQTQKQSADEALAAAEADKKRFEQYKLEAGRGDFSNVKNAQEAAEGIAKAQAAIAALTTTAASAAQAVQDSNAQLTTLSAAADKVGITAIEQASAMTALTQGADSAIASLNKLWETTNEGPQVLMDAANKFGSIFKTIGEDAVEFAKKTAEETAKAREDAEERLLDINMKLADVESDRGAALADRYIEEQRAAEFEKLNTKLEAAQAYDAALAKNKKMAEIQQEGQAEEIQQQQKFMQDQQKLLANYLKAEQEATEDYSLTRVRKLEDLYNTLSNLASQRDVAGFVNARRSGMTDIGRGDQDAGIAAQRRREQYQQAAQEQQMAYNKENIARQAQLQQKLQQEAQAGQQEVSMAARVQKQIADLRAAYAAQDLRARRAQEDLAYRQTVDVLQRKRADELKITSGAAAGVIDIVSRMRDAILKAGSGIAQGAARIPQYEMGTPYLPRTGLILAHEGERIMSAAENAQFMRNGGSGRQMGPVAIHLNVGELTTPSQLDALENRIVGALTTFASSN